MHAQYSTVVFATALVHYDYTCIYLECYTLLYAHKRMRDVGARICRCRLPAAQLVACGASEICMGHAVTSLEGHSPWILLVVEVVHAVFGSTAETTSRRGNL
jgi:hypothetical protein